MATLTKEHMRELRGAPVVDREGDKIGTLEHIYLDVRSEEPQWIAMKTGTIGGRMMFAPLEAAVIEGNTIQVMVSKEQVESSPEVFPDAISTHSEQALHQHYGMGAPAGTPAAGTHDQYAQPAPGTEDQYAQPAPGTDDQYAQPASGTDDQYAQPASGTDDQYAQPASGQPHREPLRDRLRRWEWESRQR
jgi:sporulation protein YlmC with PRC-barrel domain